METFLIKAAQLILSLSLLVIVHELGHFTFARLFKARVEKFYLFFNPWFSIFKKKIGDTVYGIGWIPLGGYVKISGMIDESMDTKAMQEPPKDYEFRAKPAWQRLLIMLGGVIFNFILAIIIYSAMLLFWGKEYLPTENLTHGVWCDSLAIEMGLQNGDKIVSVDNQVIDNFQKIVPHILFEDAHSLQVNRNGEQLDIDVPDVLTARIIAGKNFVSPRIPFIAAEFSEKSGAKASGLQKGDKLIGINDLELLFFDQYPQALKAEAGKTVNVKVEREGKQLSIPVKLSDDGKLGIYPLVDYASFFKLKKVDYNIAQAIPAGIVLGYEEIGNYLKQFKLLRKPEVDASKSVGGIISIGSLFPSKWNWQIFWSFTAMISIVLAVLNVLPIPALDGGHVMFLLFEMITGKAPSTKFLEYAQVAGMVVLLGLFVLAMKNDITNVLLPAFGY